MLWRCALGLALLAFASPAALCAQDRVWVEGGLGAGTAELAGLLALQYEPAGAGSLWSSISLRGSTTAEILGSESFWDVGLLLGPTWRWGDGGSAGHARAAIQAGVGVAGMTWEEASWDFSLMSMRRPSHIHAPEDIEYSWTTVDPSWNTIGVPLAASLSWQPVDFLGLGVHAFANANPHESFAGVVALVQVGRVR